jgi:hypothetical protein
VATGVPGRTRVQHKRVRRRFRTLDQFVDRASDVGISDSSGTFTVNPARAREEMRAFQLAQTGSYISKIVQVANRAGAITLHVKITRDKLTASFFTEDPDLCDPDRVLEALLASHSLPDSPLRHLVVGLNAATADDMREVRWETPNGSIVLTDQDICKDDTTSDNLVFVARKNRTLTRWFLGIVYLEEIEILKNHCWFGPCEISIDERLLVDSSRRWDCFAPDTDQIGISSDTERHSLLEVLDSGESDHWLFPLPVTAVEKSMDGTLRCPQDQIEQLALRPLLYRGPLDSSRLPARRALSVRPRLDGDGWLGIVKDGVLLNPIQMDLGHPGAVLMVSGDSLKTDLSEFQVVQDELFEKELAGWQDWVMRQTRSLNRDELLYALETSALEKVEENLLDDLEYWLQNHRMPDVGSIAELVEQRFPDEGIHKSPPDDSWRLERIRKIHKNHLPKHERVLAIFDDTLTGTAKLGFAITENRICWKNTLSPPDYLLWQDLDPGSVQASKLLVTVMHGEVNVTMNDTIKDCLAGFLVAVTALDHRQTYQIAPGKQSILNLALKLLGKRQGLHYYPYIPNSKLLAAEESYSEPLGNDQTPLVLYDDNLFGGGDTGFILTDTTLYWRNVLSESKSSPISELSNHTYTLCSTGIKMDGEEISMHHGELREPMTQFLRQIAATG